MSESEIKRAWALAEAIRDLPDGAKSRLIGYVEGYADAAEAERAKEADEENR